MPRDRSYSRSPRRSRSGSYDRRSNNGMNNNSNGNGYDRRGGGGGGGYRDDRHYSDRDRRDRDRSRSRSRSRSPNEEDMCRVHVADLTDSVSQYEIEKVFKKYGELKEVWLAKNPPCFAFVVFKNAKDAAIAVKEMDQRTIGNSRVKVTYARPRTKGRRRRWDPNMRCYQCGQRGHFSRDCNAGRSSYRRRSYSRERYRYRSRTRSRSRRSRSYSRSRTPPRRDRYEVGNN